MKTQQEIEEMAEKRFPTINLPPDKSFYEHNLMQHGFIKGYQEAQEEMKWISVEDRLPDAYGEYLCYHETFGIGIFIFNNVDNCWFYSNKANSAITHWHPLPQKP